MYTNRSTHPKKPTHTLRNDFKNIPDTFIALSELLLYNQGKSRLSQLVNVSDSYHFPNLMVSKKEDLKIFSQAHPKTYFEQTL